MGWLETNIFPIVNLSEVSGRYRLCRVLGLDRQHPQYYQNRDHLERLSFRLKKPVQVLERADELYLAVPEDVTALPAQYQLVRTVVQFRPTSDVLSLDYSQRNPENDLICIRFLRFFIQAPLRADKRLWQPGAGKPFFERAPANRYRNFDHFIGFALRPVVTASGGLGLCVDPASAYIGRRSLPEHLTRDEFNRLWKGRTCLYHFADTWYQIRIDGLADRNVSEYQFVGRDGETYTLLQYLLKHATKPISSELARLGHDAAVVLYRDNVGQQLAAPAPLCFPVLDTWHEDVSREHTVSILEPNERHRLTAQFVSRYTHDLQIPGVTLRIARRPIRTPERWFNVPDTRFGNSVVLSVNGTSGARHASLRELGQTRVQLLRDPAAGFFVDAPLDRHYLLLPATVHDSFGNQFVQDLSREVSHWFPKAAYNPMVVPYDDRAPRSFLNQGRRILAAAKACAPGYATVMIHETEDRQPRKEDQLGAMLMRELRERHDLRAAIIHSEMPQRAYREEQNQSGQRHYRLDDHLRKRFIGYLQNVALNHVLLNNQRWPFVLAHRLHADITIGFDVKGHTCGLVVVGANGSTVRWSFHTSRQKERLLADYVESHLSSAVRQEVEVSGTPARQLVLHQDGHAFPSHIDGARRALARLKRQGTVTPDADLTVLEISKSSPAPLRLYRLRFHGNSFAVENPQLGRYYRADDEAYLCTTGRAFPRPGTVRPLHVRRVMGEFPFESALEDLFCLTLPWTRPQDCTRYPITLKLNDRFLRAEAGEYDSDSLALAESQTEEEDVA